MFPWTIPTELACFIFDQFVRFEAQAPSNRCINVIGEFVLKYVSDNNYFPRSADEAVDRYQHPGLTEPEKYAL
ncbi:MAG: hypothetical protein EB078_10555, partial [Proteobacteria bacterium]|nr:hypothetical protein [Pseudomonadota bacterium]